MSIILWSFIAVVVSVAEASAQLETTSVTGVVVDSLSSQPIANALLRIDGARDGYLSQGDGRFSFPDTSSGARVMLVRARGYRERAVVLVAGNHTGLRVALERNPIELEGLAVTVDGVFEELSVRVNSDPRFTRRAIDMNTLRELPDDADPLFALPRAGIGIGACEGCLTLMGKVYELRPSRRGGASNLIFIDEVTASWEEFRTVPTGDLCQIDVIKAVRGSKATLHAYTCSFLEKVSRGEAHLAPLLPGWYQGSDR